MTQIRIKGLVKFFQQVRRELQQGISAARLPLIKRQVNDVVQQIDHICAQNGITPEALPAPSRNAYHFLKTVDLDRQPQKASVSPAAVPPTITLKNVIKLGEYFQQRLHRDAEKLHDSPAHLEKLGREIQEKAAEIEQLCAEQDGDPAHLAPPSQRVYSWLKFLSDPDNLRNHVGALRLAQGLLRNLSPPDVAPIEIHIGHIKPIYQVKTYANCTVLRCSEGFIAADKALWSEVLTALFQRPGRRTARLDEFIVSEAYNGVLFELEAAIEASATITRGQTHDLQASFERVNRRYFQGSMSPPRLRWNRSLTYRKMGHYQAAGDTVMLSISLDQPEVPEYVVDFVMFHELLHKKHGATLINGRRFVHTPEFRADEQRFAQYEAATQFLTQLSLRQRGNPTSSQPPPRDSRKRSTSSASKHSKPRKRSKRRKKRR